MESVIVVRKGMATAKQSMETEAGSWLTTFSFTLRKQRSWSGSRAKLKTHTAVYQWYTSSRKASPSKESRTFPSSMNNWGPNSQTLSLWGSFLFQTLRIPRDWQVFPYRERAIIKNYTEKSRCKIKLTLLPWCFFVMATTTIHSKLQHSQLKNHESKLLNYNKFILSSKIHTCEQDVSL